MHSHSNVDSDVTLMMVKIGVKRWLWVTVSLHIPKGNRAVTRIEAGYDLEIPCFATQGFRAQKQEADELNYSTPEG